MSSHSDRQSRTITMACIALVLWGSSSSTINNYLIILSGSSTTIVFEFKMLFEMFLMWKKLQMKALHIEETNVSTH